jgi:hypothetical protein
VTVLTGSQGIYGHVAVTCDGNKQLGLLIYHPQINKTYRLQNDAVRLDTGNRLGSEGAGGINARGGSIAVISSCGDGKQ